MRIAVIFIIREIKRNTWIIDTLCLITLFILFYTLWLGSYPLFTPDEGRYSEIAREMAATGDYITPRVNGIAFLDKPILYYWLQTLSIHLFGIKEWALRLMPALIGIWGCLMIYLCGRHLFNRHTALLSAGILATTPLYFGGAHYANLDLEVASLMSTSLLFFITGITNQSSLRRYFLLGAYLFSAFAALTKGLIGIVLPTVIILSWMICNKRFDYIKKMYLVRGLILFLIVVLPWYVLVQQKNPEFLHYFFVTQHFSRFLSTGEFNNASPIWFYFPIILLGFFPWTIFLFETIKTHIHTIWQTPADHPAELFLLLWIGIIFVFFSIPHSKIIGYILPIFPPLALLVAHYLSTYWRSMSRKIFCIHLISYIITTTLVAYLLLALPHYQWLEISTKFFPYLTVIAGFFLSGVILSLYLLRKNSLSLLTAICLIGNILFLLTLAHGAKHLNLNSAKPLVTELKHIQQTPDEVICYFKYYHDVPLYLGHKISIVANWDAADILRKDNWRRELWYGKRFQQTDNFLINEETFWERFHSHKRIFVFLNENYLEQFKSRASHYFYLGRSNDIILLSNQLSKNPPS